MITKSNRCKLVFKDLSDSTQVNSGGGTNTQLLQPPAGKIWNVILVRIAIPAPIGATSDDHTLDCELYDGSSDHRLWRMVSNFNATININQNGFGATTESPSGDNQFLLIYQWSWCSNSYPIRLIYTNDSDANQTGNREIYIFVKEYNEAE